MLTARNGGPQAADSGSGAASVTAPKRKEYDLDAKDAFWRSNVGTIFPEVARTCVLPTLPRSIQAVPDPAPRVLPGSAEHVEVELAKYKEEYDRVTRITGQLSSDDLLRCANEQSTSAYPPVLMAHA